MKKKSKRSKKATKNSKRTRVARKPEKETNAATIPELSVGRFSHPVPVTRSEAGRAHIAAGTRLFALAGRPTKAQFVKVYGPQGPKMTWVQQAKAGVDAKHFQEALKAKS